jgi:hypothetical protein
MTESPKEMAREAQTGESSRTYPLALTGVTLAVTAVVAVILLAALLVYYLV